MREKTKNLLALVGLLTLLWIIFEIALNLVLNYLMPRDHQLVSKKISPNSRFTMHAFQSHTEGDDHAPYGDILVLSRKDSLDKPSEGYVIFAGYCIPPLNYAWVTDSKIRITCNAADAPKTVVSAAYGITVELQHDTASLRTSLPTAAPGGPPPTQKAGQK